MRSGQQLGRSPSQLYLFDQAVQPDQLLSVLTLQEDQCLLSAAVYEEQLGASPADLQLRTRHAEHGRGLLLTLSSSLRHVTLCGMAVRPNLFQLVRSRYQLNSHSFCSLARSPHPFLLREDFSFKQVVEQAAEQLTLLQKKGNPQYSYWLCFLACHVLQSAKAKPVKALLSILQKYPSLTANLAGTSLETVWDELCG